MTRPSRRGPKAPPGRDRLNDMPGTPLLELHHVTLRLRDRHVFTDTTWEIRRGEHWGVLGPNGSGKTTLARALVGETPVVAGRVIRHQPGVRVSLVGPESYRSAISADRRLDPARYASGRADERTTASDLLVRPDDTARFGRSGFLKTLLDRFGLSSILDRAIRDLSSGEMRKLLLARALSSQADVFVLDEPYDGLDTDSRLALAEALDSLTRPETSVIVITHRPEELPPAVSRVLFVRGCRLAGMADRAAVVAGTETIDPRIAPGNRPRSADVTGRASPTAPDASVTTSQTSRRRSPR